MDNNTRGRQRHNYSTYVPAVDDLLSPPPSPAEIDHRPTQPADGSLGFIAIVASLLVTTIIIVAMLIDGQQAGRAILVGATFFAVLVIVIALLLTGTLSAIVATVQHERTERARIDAYADAAEMALEWRLQIERNRALELQPQAPPPAQGTQTPYEHRTFVSPYATPNETAREAIEWARALYLDNGQPDPGKVQTEGENVGWLKIRMLGSKRDMGSREAGVWLLNHKVILRERNGYAVNLRHYPTRESLRALPSPPRGESGGHAHPPMLSSGGEAS